REGRPDPRGEVRRPLAGRAQAGSLRDAAGDDVRRGHAALRGGHRSPDRPARLHLPAAPRGEDRLHPRPEDPLRRNVHMRMSRTTLAVALATGLAFAGGARPAAAGEFGVSLEGGYFGM